MKELLLACAVAAAIVIGYFMMKKIDTFLENNRHYIDRENTKSSR